MPFKNILVCVDFSDISDAVVESAALIASAFNAKLNLLTIVERPVPFIHEGFEGLVEPEEIEILIELEKQLRKEAEEKLTKYASKITEKGIEVKTIIEVSEIVDGILENIKKENTDLVVVGSHKKGLLDRLLLGSISEKVINKSPVSTLVIKGEPIKAINKILVGYDFLPNSKEALNVATELAERFKSEVFIVHADTDASLIHLSSIYNKVKEKKIKLLEEIISKIKEKNIPVKYEILEEKPVEAIIEEIEKYNPDLTVVGKRKSSKFKAMFLGSTAMKVVKESKKSVLIVRKEND
jgi:nucleotide-binding universal stress UspA family protein